MKAKRIVCLWVFFFLSALSGVSVPDTVWAQDDDDEVFQSLNRTSVEKARQRLYVGARDEQNLEVQPSLPQPSRSPDGTSAPPPPPADGDNSPATD
jgi:hypothetical protein